MCYAKNNLYLLIQWLFTYSLTVFLKLNKMLVKSQKITSSSGRTAHQSVSLVESLKSDSIITMLPVLTADMQFVHYFPRQVSRATASLVLETHFGHWISSEKKKKKYFFKLRKDIPLQIQETYMKQSGIRKKRRPMAYNS